MAADVLAPCGTRITAAPALNDDLVFVNIYL